MSSSRADIVALYKIEAVHEFSYNGSSTNTCKLFSYITWSILSSYTVRLNVLIESASVYYNKKLKIPNLIQEITINLQSFYHRVQYLQANDQGVFMKTVFDSPLPSDGKYYQMKYIFIIILLGQFLLQSLDKFSNNYHMKSIDAAARYVCLHPGDHPQLASLLEVTL